MIKILEKKNSTIHEKLQSLVGLFSFAAKVVYTNRAFLQHFYNILAKDGKDLCWLKPIKDNLFC